MTAEAVAALQALDALTDEPLLLGFHPRDSLNPYQALLYGRAWEHGIAPVPIDRLATIDELVELARLGFPTVLHLHWLNQVLRDATTADEARRAVAAFLERLDGYLAAGGRVVWTVHNVLSHGARFPEEEAALSAGIVERAAGVHILAGTTPALAAPWYAIPPQKAFHVPHPSYAGAYENVISRHAARHRLGLAPDETVFVVLGAIRGYKGLDRLLDAWERFDAVPGPRRLVIAGRRTDDPGVSELIERAALHPSVLVHPKLFEPGDVQVYLRAADLALHPYVGALNSGALLLALTFGLPSIVPAGSGLAEVVDERSALTFDDADPDGLLAALRGAGLLIGPEGRAAALEVAARHDPGMLSDRFAVELRRVLG
jgi:glycosyltransferase involved in cell wall biosynthesis